MPKSQRFNFKNQVGELLAGRLELPEHPQAFAVFAHCFTCSKNIRAASQISRALAAQGIAVLRFDFTGLGNSEGDFSNSNYSSNVDDLVSAANALAVEFQAPHLLIGHSLGGTASLMAATQLPGIRAVATIGSPAEPKHVLNLLGTAGTAAENADDFQVTLAGRDFTIRKQFVDDLNQTDLPLALRDFKSSTLIFHSPQDELVPLDQAHSIYQNLPHPKTFLALDGADHLLSSQDDAQYVADTLSAWCRRYLPGDGDERPRVEDGEVVVRQLDGFTHQVFSVDHDLMADEPTRVGGENTGMTPYDLLLASLGTCTSMTLDMYAKHKKLTVSDITVRLRHEKIHAEDCAACESDKGKVDRISRIITVRGDLDEKQLRRLGEIADRCPVHRTMMREKEITTSIDMVD